MVSQVRAFLLQDVAAVRKLVARRQVEISDTRRRLNEFAFL
ncbi:MAG: hypothetical protein WD969_05140 [Paracoccaceae bacterium]